MFSPACKSIWLQGTLSHRNWLFKSTYSMYVYIWISIDPVTPTSFIFTTLSPGCIGEITSEPSNNRNLSMFCYWTCRIPTLYVSSYFGVCFSSVLSQGLVSTGGWKKRTFFVYQIGRFLNWLFQKCIVHNKLDIYVFINFYIFYIPLSSRTPCVHCLFISSVINLSKVFVEGLNG
jgi:hypothetical protein